MKREKETLPEAMLRSRVTINLNPYQGLKPERSVFWASCKSSVTINLNPYQGLKLTPN
ncbi:conserved hypothetical protein [Kamptonema sp. PCC 6506]|nr:conserved hypothetical protein [Kamptonema sp. PCC 6506]